LAAGSQNTAAANRLCIFLTILVQVVVKQANYSNQLWFFYNCIYTVVYIHVYVFSDC